MDETVRLLGGQPVFYELERHDGYLPDPDRIASLVTPRTKALFLNTPNNPTGAVLPPERIEAILSVTSERGVWVISDEVYDHLVYDGKEYPSVLSCCSDLDHVMVISSFSKTFSMAGMRIGWLMASQGAIKKLRRYHMFTTTVANTPCQWAGVAALRGERTFIDNMLVEYQRRRDRLVDLVKATPHLTGYRPDGAFYLFPSLPEGVNGGNVALKLLRETGVCTVAGETFGDSCSNALRISYSTSLDQIEAAFERIIPWMEKQDW